MAVAIQTKARVRYSSRGWFRFMFSYFTGSRDFRTGKMIPDNRGCFEQELWCGPFTTFDEAVCHVW